MEKIYGMFPKMQIAVGGDVKTTIPPYIVDEITRK